MVSTNIIYIVYLIDCTGPFKNNVTPKFTKRNVTFLVSLLKINLKVNII